MFSSADETLSMIDLYTPSFHFSEKIKKKKNYLFPSDNRAIILYNLFSNNNKNVMPIEIKKKLFMNLIVK